MTLATGHNDMEPDQRVLRLIMIEVHVRPLSWGVALLALLAKHAAVRLVGSVAVDALGTQLLLLHHAGVAKVAIDVCVSAFERELESAGVIEARNLPPITVMTVRTRRSHATGMRVVRLVATNAIFRYRGLQIAATVAVVAADSGVFAIKGKSGLPRMVEPLRGPVRRGMAMSTLRSLAALVNVIGHVAADALLRRPLVVLACMAGIARDLTMRVRQRKVCHLVVEAAFLP